MVGCVSNWVASAGRKQLSGLFRPYSDRTSPLLRTGDFQPSTETGVVRGERMRANMCYMSNSTKMQMFHRPREIELLGGKLWL